MKKSIRGFRGPFIRHHGDYNSPGVWIKEETMRGPNDPAEELRKGATYRRLNPHLYDGLYLKTVDPRARRGL